MAALHVPHKAAHKVVSEILKDFGFGKLVIYTEKLKGDIVPCFNRRIEGIFRGLKRILDVMPQHVAVGPQKT